MELKHRLSSSARIIIGIGTIIVGVVLYSSSSDHVEILDYIYSTSFGGDYYTYQYGVTRNAALNVAAVAQIVEEIAKFAGIAFIIWGLLIIVRASEYTALLSLLSRPSSQDETDNKTRMIQHIVNNESTPVNSKTTEPIWNKPSNEAQETKTFTQEEADKEIRKYISLFDKGIIDEEEFINQKNEIMSKVR